MDGDTLILKRAFRNEECRQHERARQRAERLAARQARKARKLAELVKQMQATVTTAAYTYTPSTIDVYVYGAIATPTVYEGVTYSGYSGGNYIGAATTATGLPSMFGYSATFTGT